MRALTSEQARASGVEITQILRRNRAKKLQNFWNFGEPRTQNLRALGPRTLRKPQNTVATLHRVGSALCMQKSPSDAPKSGREDGTSCVYRHHKYMIILAPSEHCSVLLTCSDPAVLHLPGT